jgi:hypothetical protein
VAIGGSCRPVATARGDAVVGASSPVSHTEVRPVLAGRARRPTDLNRTGREAGTMFVENRIGPTLEALRPMRPTRTEHFPVHPELVDHLVAVQTHPDDIVAHVLGVCSAYAYADPDTVAMIVARLGLPESHVRQVALYVDPMFISSTAYLIQSADGRVVLLAYRGTEPMRLVNWLTDADLYPDRVAIPLGHRDHVYEVHGGFYRNVRATRYQLVAALQRALEGRSIDERDDERRDERLQPLEALYVTGHSLGGAMAALMGVMLATLPAYAPLAERLRGVYTYGQPMIGPHPLARACGEHPFLSTNVVRYIYQRDVVAFLPPRDTGVFEHFGQERQYLGSWPWQVNAQGVRQMAFAAELAEVPLSFLAHRFAATRRLPFRYRLDDHLPHHYVAALTPPGIPNEYGDDPVTLVGRAADRDDEPDRRPADVSFEGAP